MFPAIECKRHNDIEHGFLNMSGNQYGDIANVSCNSGYRLVGPISIACQHDRTWTKSGECIRINMNQGSSTSHQIPLALQTYFLMVNKNIVTRNLVY